MWGDQKNYNSFLIYRGTSQNLGQQFKHSFYVLYKEIFDTLWIPKNKVESEKKLIPIFFIQQFNFFRRN